MQGEINQNIDLVLSNNFGQFFVGAGRGVSPHIRMRAEQFGERIGSRGGGVTEDFKSFAIVLAQ